MGAYFLCVYVFLNFNSIEKKYRNNNSKNNSVRSIARHGNIDTKKDKLLKKNDDISLILVSMDELNQDEGLKINSIEINEELNLFLKLYLYRVLRELNLLL